jgi:hypothetical protein
MTIKLPQDTDTEHDNIHDHELHNLMTRYLIILSCRLVASLYHGQALTVTMTMTMTVTVTMTMTVTMTVTVTVTVTMTMTMTVTMTVMQEVKAELSLHPPHLPWSHSGLFASLYRDHDHDHDHDHDRDHDHDHDCNAGGEG